MNTLSVMSCNIPTVPYAIQRAFSAFQLQLISRPEYCQKIDYVLSLAADKDIDVVQSASVLSPGVPVSEVGK